VIEARLAKTVMVASLSAFALLVACNNIVDYQSNFTVLRHVLSMDTTFKDNALMHRAVTDPWLWTAAYWGIIAAEALTGLAFGWAAVAMACNTRRGGAGFQHSKRFVYVGATLGFLLWFGGFMLVGGEWLTMWQSTQWNGLQAAFRFYVTILLVLLFVVQRDDAP